MPLGEGGVVLHRTTHRTLYSHGTVVMITASRLLLEPSESKSSERSSHGLTAYPVDSIGGFRIWGTLSTVVAALALAFASL